MPQVTAQRACAVIIFARTASISRTQTDEPYGALPWDELDALFTAFLGDVIQTVVEVPDVDIHLYRNMEELSDDFLLPFREKVRLFELPAGTFSEQVQHSVENAFAEHYGRVLILFENHPSLKPAFIRKMIDQLGYDDDCVVVSPAYDGRCVLLGMKMNHSWIFDSGNGDPLVKPYVLLERLCALNAVVFPTPPVYTLDCGAHLARLREDVLCMEQRGEPLPRRTQEMFNLIEKRYKLRKVTR